MGKKQKKKKATVTNANEQQLEDRALKAVQNDNYHQAQTFYRKLVKQNAEKFMPELIKVQHKLLNELIYQKKWDEVKDVLASLQKADPAGSMLLLPETQLAMAQGDFEKAAQAAVKWITATAQLEMQHHACMADALVLAFCPGHAYNVLPEEICRDLNKIHSALEAVGQNAISTALANIKPIGLKSLFCEWKWFIKGVCAFYSQEDTKALAAFDKLTKASIPGKAAAAYRLMIEGPNEPNAISKSSQVNQGVCLLMGLSDMAAPLARAQYLWKVERYRDSYKHLSAGLTDFPTQTPGLNHCLTLFYYGAFHQMSPSRAENYIVFLMAEAMKQRPRHTIEKLLAAQAMALWLEKTEDVDRDIFSIWEDVIGHFNALANEGPRADVLVYVRLGNLFAEEEPDDEDSFDFFSLHRRRKKGMVLRDAELAESCYQKALAADPNSRIAHLALLSLYEKTDENSKINQALDTIIKIFPDEKDALYKAGLLCAKRNALVKSLKYLEQALILDPIDRRLRESFIVVCIKAARAYAKKGDLQKCVATLQKAESKASKSADDLNLSFSYLYARWAAILHLFENQTHNAVKMLAKAVSLCRDPLKLHYFTWLIGCYYGAPAEALKESRDIVEETLAAHSDPAIGAMLVQVLRYCMPMLFENKRLRMSEIKYINKYLLAAARPECHREHAQIIAEYALSDEIRNTLLAKTYIKLILNKTPDNARFRWLKFQSDFSMDAHPSLLTRKKNELQKIIELAGSQGDQEVVQMAQKIVAKITEIIKTFQQFKSFIEDFDFNDDDDDDDYDDDYDDEIDSPTSSKSKNAPDSASFQAQLDLFDFLDFDTPKK